MSLHFATSRRSDMQPLTCQGIEAPFCYDQLHSFLTQHADELAARGMPDAGSFLAEPVHDPGGITDWHAPGDTRPVPLAELAPEEQEALLARFDRCAGALESLLAHEGSALASPLPELLRFALRHPSREDIYSLNGRPLLINWGFAAGMTQAVPEDIVRRHAVPEPKPEPGPEPVRSAVPADPAPAPDPAPEPAPEPGLPPGSAALPGSELPPRAAAPVPGLPAPAPRRGCLSFLLPLLGLLLLAALALALLGHLPGGCSRPLFTPGTPPSGAHLEIPEDAAARNDLSFLEGCWRNVTPLATTKGEQVDALYCFRADGRGERSLSLPSGHCQGSLSASFENGELHLSVDRAQCSPGSSSSWFVGENVICTGSGRHTNCRGREETGKEWDAGFVRQ